MQNSQSKFKVFDLLLKINSPMTKDEDRTKAEKLLIKMEKFDPNVHFRDVIDILTAKEIDKRSK